MSDDDHNTKAVRKPKSAVLKPKPITKTKCVAKIDTDDNAHKVDDAVGKALARYVCKKAKAV
ncbi:hypothetical protein [Bartonella tamiae]|uniref:Uncharacterized protein n=1 Tax=Bartonella tamiae Th239 TaxID=1094558 RepID=J1JWX7_9HYPH|nr:hypothetical protein [Bartonella tamiae]EJF89094.1 hypothetical protein ME5_01645 [Bartonella tamiae Th239]EJF89100.1 hypothetical protein ME5_01651 [Bartonella tamiae Th239]EJF94650.1 hypothetical protein MEG_00231 [Bartonella tamiae Th307]EJF94656.1 hypothetical protein MEG_00237 [Bartonella tamiae Th307]EJF95497.1 hypothetical protein MEG_00230 [Bartonella tamiae Th307]